MRQSFFLLFLLFATISDMQGQLYTQHFESCNLTSPIGSAVANVSLKCGCGVPGQAMEFNGSNGGLTLPDSLLKLMKNDFTIDFYLNIKNITQEQVDLVSITNECDIDSTITIKYLQLNNEIIVELLLNKGQYFPIKGKLDDRCWNRITLVKDKLTYYLYINNEEAGKSITPQNVIWANNAKFAFSNSPCLSTIDDRLIGSIDEISVYNKPLTRTELTATFTYPDRIINRDTSIFLGQTISLSYPNTCTSIINWTPDADLPVSTGKSIIVTPETTTTYIVEASGNGCNSIDSVTVYVLDPEKQTCDNLLLPQAFSPNGDNINDEFKISNFFIVEQLKDFTILNRWGEIMETIAGVENGWTGQYKDQKAEPGSYLYKIKYTCKGEEYKKIGSFFLLK